MKTPSNNYQWVTTEDGSQTLHSDLYGEACHSTSGAKTETLLHYLEGCEVTARIELFSAFEILEVGFGLGLGFLTTLEVLGTDRSWHFVSMEIDPDLVKWFLDEYKSLPIIANAKWITPKLVEGQYQNVKLSIIVGDARVEVEPYLTQKSFRFHAIFQDAFSPKRNPHLWTVEWFELLRQHSHEECILSTYSASSSIRKSLVESGWKITKGHKFGPKRSSTRARLTGTNDEDIIIHLERSPVGAIYDKNIDEFIKKTKGES